MFSLEALTGTVHRAWKNHTRRRQRSRRFLSSRRLGVRALEDRLCLSSSYLVVASYDNNSIFRYDENTGAFIDQIDPKNQANLNQPSGMVFGLDHNLYVSERQFFSNHQAVLRYDGTSGAFQSVFASQNLGSPRGILFGPDGDLYVADGGSGSVGNATIDRFDGQTGAFLGYFVSAGSGGIAHPGFMVFGPDGNLYVSDVHAGQILRYYGPNSANPGAPDPAPGQSGAIFIPPSSDGLDAPGGLAFSPDGNLYVASGNWFTSPNGPVYSSDFPPGAVLKFEGPSGPNPGASLGTFIAGGYGGLANPTAVLFGPNGDLYVSSCVARGPGLFKADAGTSVVLRYDGTTGAFLSTFVTPDSGGLRFPLFMTFTETDPTTLNYDGASPNGTPTAAGNQMSPTVAQTVHMASWPGIAVDSPAMPPVSALVPAAVTRPISAPVNTSIVNTGGLLQASEEIASWSFATVARSQQSQNPLYADVDSMFADPLALGLRQDTAFEWR